MDTRTLRQLLEYVARTWGDYERFCRDNGYLRPLPEEYPSPIEKVVVIDETKEPTG